MNNFEYSNPTRLVFGKGEESRIGELMRARVPAMSPVLVVYGGGSAKESGLLERISESLKAADLVPIELGGVTPNPQLSFVQKGILLAREHRVKAILAVGGGSVIDASKAIAIGVPYVGDVWDFFTKKITPTEALPVAAVLTLPAAGSEQSIRIVISNGDRKLGAGSPLVRPFVSVIDPELFFTLPEKQIRAGVIDMMSHIMERYFTQTKNTDFVDSQAESAMKTIMKNGLKLKKNPKDYAAWCQIGLAGSFAHNGYYGLGQVEDWASHGMEHELSAWDTTITHGEGLAVVVPAWMKYVWHANPKRFVQFARNVMGVKGEGTDEEIIRKGIKAFRRFLKKMGAPKNLKELGAEKADPKELAKKAVEIPGKLGNFLPLYEKDIVKIYKLMR